jgi:hypothetical protein
MLNNSQVDKLENPKKLTSPCHTFQELNSTHIKYMEQSTPLGWSIDSECKEDIGQKPWNFQIGPVKPLFQNKYQASTIGTASILP